MLLLGKLRPWGIQVLFYALFFGTTALLEPYRANHRTLNSSLSPILAAIFSVVFVRWFTDAGEPSRYG